MLTERRGPGQRGFWLLVSSVLPHGGTSAPAEVWRAPHGTKLQIWGFVRDYTHTKKGYGREKNRTGLTALTPLLIQASSALDFMAANWFKIIKKLIENVLLHDSLFPVISLSSASDPGLAAIFTYIFPFIRPILVSS